MALTSCKEWGGQVSTHADVCPHCGIHSPRVPDEMMHEVAIGCGIGALVAVVILAVAIWTLGYLLP
jgi:hypothetical protein